MSDAAIAEHCGVSDRMVAGYRPTTKVSESADELPTPPPLRTGRDGC